MRQFYVILACNSVKTRLGMLSLSLSLCVPLEISAWYYELVQKAGKLPVDTSVTLSQLLVLFRSLGNVFDMSCAVISENFRNVIID